MPKPPLRRSPAILLCAVLLGACATSAPVVVTTSAADSARVARDTEQCRRQATAAVGLNGRDAGTLAQAAGKAGTVGFVGGAVGSLVAGSKDAWQKARGAAAGGASGIAAKVLLEWNEPDDVHQEFVERCMKKRGHDVLGWR
jgi:outer membrane lipoprotein SlyB